MSPQAVAIVGPTASGKTGLGLAVARQLGSEVVSADAMQVYRGMAVGTAAPTASERAQVPHHFVACLPPDSRMSAGAFQQQARAVVRQINARGTPAVVVGGSGLYLSALLDGLFDGPAADERVRAQLQAEAEAAGNAALFALLARVDPAYAATLTSPNDRVRIVRALEVHALTGQPLSALHAAGRAAAEPLDARWFAIDWPREVLYARIDARVEQMVADGWVEEVRALIDNGYGPELERLKALGCREMAAHLRGEQSLDAAVAATQQHHRRYAKRQLTWFRADARITWLPPERAEAARVLAALDA